LKGRKPFKLHLSLFATVPSPPVFLVTFLRPLPFPSLTLQEISCHDFCDSSIAVHTSSDVSAIKDSSTTISSFSTARKRGGTNEEVEQSPEIETPHEGNEETEELREKWYKN
jgi:hypothetical protein